MAIDHVRGGNPRCPSLLLGGLMLACLFFACSWWSLTSQNFELLHQISQLEEKVEYSSSILETCQQTKQSLEDRLRNLQNDEGQQRIKIEQLKSVELELQDNLKRLQDELNAANKKVSSVESSLTFKNTELESLKRLDEAKNKTLEALRAEKKSLNLKLLEVQAKAETCAAGLPKQRDPVVDLIKKKQDRINSNHDVEGAGAGIVENLNHAIAEAQDKNDAAEAQNIESNPEPEPQDEVKIEDRERVMHPPLA